MELLKVVLLIHVVAVRGRFHDHPAPPPLPDEDAGDVDAWTVQEEDNVLAMERELEQELGLQHRDREHVPPDDDYEEFPKLVSSSADKLPGYKPDSKSFMK